MTSAYPFHTLSHFKTGNGTNGQMVSLPALETAGIGAISRLPVSIRMVLESVLRHCDGQRITELHVRQLANWQPNGPRTEEIPFVVSRVILQDFTGVPLLADLAAMRAAAVLAGKDPGLIEPLAPVDMVVDHSVQVDVFGQADALQQNMALEFSRNQERYELLKWGMQAFDTFKVVPPGIGIVHQVNMEYLAHGVMHKGGMYFPDSLVGTDSHTTMINGLGIVAWGVGGIEAEAAMLGQPVYFLTPDVVGVNLLGHVKAGVTATDVVLTLTEMLRCAKVVGKFVEFFGEGARALSLPDRATIANMAPEYGATIGYFPVDEQTLQYLRLSGRPDDLIATVEQYAKAQGLWRQDAREIAYSSTLSLDLSTVEPSLAGPRRPQDRVALSAMQSQWRQDLSLVYGKVSTGRGSNMQSWEGEGGNGYGNAAASVSAAAKTDVGFDGVPVQYEGHNFALKHGAVVIAAITSCTNTSNPSVMIAAGLVAQKARKFGLTRKPWVKTSLAPGSKVVMDYLSKAGLVGALEECGFFLVGFGCTTCIGNSGPLPEPISRAIAEGDLVAAAVLSGNRNFEGRISPEVKANYLASPPLVVAYALAGTVDFDFQRTPLGHGADGKPVLLADIWPSQREVDEAVAKNVLSEHFRRQYANVFEGSPEWKAIKTSPGEVFDWDENSTYIQEPPFFVGMDPKVAAITAVKNAHCLAYLGDSITTDHISPAGSIKKDGPAGRFLLEHGVTPAMFNSYGSRRGNDRVMTRGTFANIRVKNKLAPGTEGGVTLDFTDQQVKSIYDAAVNYHRQGVPLVILAGKDYGMGSSRDWAAKGTFLLGVRAVIAESFERIHRSNLVGMGVLPLQFKAGENAASLGLTGYETFDILGLESLAPGQEVSVVATKADGKQLKFSATVRIDTAVEVDYYRNGGILQTVLKKILAQKARA